MTTKKNENKKVSKLIDLEVWLLDEIMESAKSNKRSLSEQIGYDLEEIYLQRKIVKGKK